MGLGMKKYSAQSGKSEDFLPDIMIPGEFAMFTDKHMLVFCFGKDDIVYLEADKSVDENTARDLILKIDQFLENSYRVSRERFLAHVPNIHKFRLNQF